MGSTSKANAGGVAGLITALLLLLCNKLFPATMATFTPEELSIVVGAVGAAVGWVTTYFAPPNRANPPPATGGP